MSWAHAWIAAAERYRAEHGDAHQTPMQSRPLTTPVTTTHVAGDMTLEEIAETHDAKRYPERDVPRCERCGEPTDGWADGPHCWDDIVDLAEERLKA